eukprot:CAMPEP_0197030398 /NCGR_PEP_ID=MMETSP1384-20130603/9640_1 /TAXON_ID=29189 /ORGANISM="Ammonia sp." /LENGTH=1050 /DNA_ID=CAMNT_0042459733 /DNA_START=73 /DNA_END=3225 /DNA_ORIENTATION=-
MMEVQLLSREYFNRCDLQEKYMSLEKCAETFAISHKLARSVYQYIRSNNLVDDVPFNYARKLALLYLQTNGRASVTDGHDFSINASGQSSKSDSKGHAMQQEWSRIYNDAQPTGQGQGMHLHTPRKSVLQLPRLYLTFENFCEASVYLSPRASMQQRIDLAFSIFDTNGDGIIDAQDIQCVMLDSLQSNLRNGSHGGDQDNVQQIFKKEVDELINDLKSQYGSDQFHKEEFIEFAQNVEFLNCFTVNKHWLRDILGNDNTKTQYARPQDAEMKQFLETIAEEQKIDAEEITDLQEKLRDNLVDTVEDLKTIKMKHFDHMKVNRRVSEAIYKHLKRMQTEQEEEYDGMGMASLFDNVGANDMDDPMSQFLGEKESWWHATKCANCVKHMYFSYIAKRLPSLHTSLTLCFNLLYLTQILISSLVVMYSASSSDESAYHKIGRITSHGLYLCLFLAPWPRYFVFISKWVSLTANSNLAHFVLYFTSSESEKINIAYFVAFVFIHSLCYILQDNAASLSTFDLSAISAVLMLVFGVILIALCVRIYRAPKSRKPNLTENKAQTSNPLQAAVPAANAEATHNPYTIPHQLFASLTKLAFVVCFIVHCTSSSSSYGAQVLLYIALLPLIIILILLNYQYLLSSQPMDVHLAKNERPNYVLLSIKNDKAKMRKWKCGQYIEVNCPSISAWEHHPFYITSSPDDQWINLSVLSCGDWTQKLWQLYVSENVDLQPLKISGPFGVGFTCNRMNYNFDYLLIVATGNGSVEIIASLLQFVCSNFLANDKHPITKIYCYWMVSVDEGCYWFYKLLRDLRIRYSDQFHPCIFVTSSTHDDRANAFGLNFFLALRRESLQTNLLSQQIRLSAGRISTFRRPVSIFAPNQRASRFQSNKVGPMASGLLNEPKDQIKVGKHGVEINNVDTLNEEEIPMQSPDFRHAFNKIREELMQQHNKEWEPQSPSMSASSMGSPMANKVGISSLNKLSAPSKQNSLHGIVPALLVATNNSAMQRTYNVGTFFAGSDILETRLQRLCQQFTDDQVMFEFNSMVVGDNYAKRYST